MKLYHGQQKLPVAGQILGQTLAVVVGDYAV